jgi:hypothetical protein
MNQTAKDAVNAKNDKKTIHCLAPSASFAVGFPVFDAIYHFLFVFFVPLWFQNQTILMRRRRLVAAP